MSWSPTIESIKQVAAARFGVPVREMTSRRQAQKATLARMAAMAMAKRLTDRSLVEIGRQFGGRDHTTVINAVRRIEAAAAGDMRLMADLEAIAAEVERGAPKRTRQELEALARLLAPMIVGALPAATTERVVERVEVPIGLPASLHAAVEAVATAYGKLESARYSPAERPARHHLERCAKALRDELKSLKSPTKGTNHG